jgi:hypothetical protein
MQTHPRQEPPSKQAINVFKHNIAAKQKHDIY